MRGLLLLFFSLTAICTYGLANGESIKTTMAEFTVAVDHAASYCTDPIDPNNCLPPPIGFDTVFINPNDPATYGDIVVAYRFNNGTGFTITQYNINDSAFGVIVPPTSTSVGPGSNVFLTVRHTPITIPGTYDITATMTLVESGGNSIVLTADYVVV
ncbi:MAG: hypothetical protein AAFU67_05880, partial [Bacteroidota bacterium]